MRRSRSPAAPPGSAPPRPRVRWRSPLRRRAAPAETLSEGAFPAPAEAQSASNTAAPKPDATATLEECLSSGPQSERSATFAGEMSAITGSAKMEMRIEVLERLPEEALFHAVIAPGLGVWRSAAPGVKVFRFLKQVSNLSAPAVYRGAVQFRWLGARGRPIKNLELRTAALPAGGAARDGCPAPARRERAPVPRRAPERDR